MGRNSKPAAGICWWVVQNGIISDHTTNWLCCRCLPRRSATLSPSLPDRQLRDFNACPSPARHAHLAQRAGAVPGVDAAARRLRIVFHRGYGVGWWSLCLTRRFA